MHGERAPNHHYLAPAGKSEKNGSGKRNDVEGRPCTCIPPLRGLYGITWERVRRGMELCSNNKYRRIYENQ